MEHPPASSAIADHAAIITELRSLLNDANADIARRHLDMNKAMGRVYAAEARIEDRDITITAICSELAEARKDRASIVAFLAAEAGRFDRSARSASGDFVYDKRALEISCDKLRAQADIVRSIAAQIARGDDRQGGE